MLLSPLVYAAQCSKIPHYDKPNFPEKEVGEQTTCGNGEIKLLYRINIV